MFLLTPGGMPRVYAVDLILNKTVFGPNGQIIVEIGNINPGCRDPIGIPASDIYVVPAGSVVPYVRLVPLASGPVDGLG